MSMFLLAPAVLLLGLACQPRAATPVFLPWEEGLTLTFEDPSLPQPQRWEARLQVRVAHSEVAPGAPGLIQLDMTSIHGQMIVLARPHDGGIDLIADDGRVYAQALAPGFPATTAWVVSGTEFRVLGRAAWDGAALLPPTSDPIGYWVEVRPPQGPRRRFLYLPDLGEVESREERNGAWVVVNRLVARGFTDLPAFKRIS
jgi:hypothetical protein